MQTALAIGIIVFALALLFRGHDVRLVLFAAGLALASLAKRPWLVLDAFEKTMANGDTMGPICSAMGYAYVLRATRSDQAMVRLLIAPLRRRSWLLVPGGCLVGFVTNMAITSQTAVAASVGAVLAPLMLAAGYPRIVIAATLVLGCSVGGNLYNPGDADVVAIYDATKAGGTTIVQVLDAMFLPELAGMLATVAAFFWLCRNDPREPLPPDPAAESDESIDYIRALLPPLPIVMLFASQPRFELFPTLLEIYPAGLPVPHAMLVSTMIALAVTRVDSSQLTRDFFEGLGYAYVHVISLIIAATCFIKGMEAVGMIEHLVGAVRSSGPAGKVASAAFPWLLAVISGSGTAPSVAFSKAVLPGLAGDPAAAIDLGVLGAIGATFGRTMSPVAAVVIYTSILVGVPPMAIVKRTAPPLAVGAVAVLVVMLLR